MEVLMDSGVLFVSPNLQDARSLAQMLDDVSLPLVHAISLKEAASKLETDNFKVVLTEATLEDGTWLDVLKVARSTATELVVTHPWADARFWAEAINLGAYDLLAQPFLGTEVRRVLASASGRKSAVTAHAAA
jgi:two-component system response regulator PilR (NtrC family)